MWEHRRQRTRRPPGKLESPTKVTKLDASMLAVLAFASRELMPAFPKKQGEFEYLDHSLVKLNGLTCWAMLDSDHTLLKTARLAPERVLGVANVR
jgi:hypothetical protein